MTNFVTELFWEEEKQPVLPAPQRPHDQQQDKKEKAPAPAAPVENQAERMQRLAGNSALAREAEEAEATRKRLAEAAIRPEKVAAKPVAASAQKRAEKSRAKSPADPKAPPAAREKAAKERAVQNAMTAEAQRLSEATKAAAVRAAALAQVLASFDKNAGKAELLALAQLTETAPSGNAEETARIIALAVMRADPEQRAAIAARIKTELGDRHDMRLARLMADRLAWLVIATRPAPPPPPPPPPPP